MLKSRKMEFKEIFIKCGDKKISEIGLELLSEIDKLHEFVMGLATRVHKQSELLSKKAEKK